MFVSKLDDTGILRRVARLDVQLYGSLGATGRGHGTDKAVILGLEGEAPRQSRLTAYPNASRRSNKPPPSRSSGTT